MTTQEKVREAHAHHEHLKQIALKLFEQLKSEKVDFSDAERIDQLQIIAFGLPGFDEIMATVLETALPNKKED